MTNIAIFVSGNGTNCENIIKYFSNNDKVNVSIVISNRPDAYALVRAAKYGVPCTVLSKTEINDEATIMPMLQKYDVDFIVLAGFMLMVPEFLTNKFNRRIVNIHPSLLPKFGGKGMWGDHVHRAVLAAGEQESGITIHYVSEEVDEGQTIAQFRCPVMPDDTPETLATRIHQLEHEHLPAVIRQLLNEL